MRLQICRYKNRCYCEWGLYDNEGFEAAEHFIDNTKLIASYYPENEYQVHVYDLHTSPYEYKYTLWDSERQKVKEYVCPMCNYDTTGIYPRICPKCEYNGDWIQPGYLHTYELRKAMIENQGVTNGI